MNTKVAILLFGLAIVASAADYGKIRMRPNAAPAKAAYGQPAVQEEPEVVEESVQYAPAPAVQPAVRASVRVAKEPVATTSYGSNSRGSYRASSSTYEAEAEDTAEDQAKNAHYSFGSAIDDGIMDHSHVRLETRDGLKVEGSYAYSDGYFKRVVNYIADENGYRVVSESVEPISETGPKIDLINGKADIHTQISGVDTQYQVSADEIRDVRRKVDAKEVN